MDTNLFLSLSLYFIIENLNMDVLKKCVDGKYRALSDPWCNNGRRRRRGLELTLQEFAYRL